MPPDVVAHADWSVSPAKRWITVARWDGARYLLEPPAPFATVGERLARLGPNALLGLDVTIGLPAAYARRAGIVRFAPWLRDGVDLDVWGDVAVSATDVSLERPFFPRRPGGACQRALVDALGVASFDDLRRACERTPPLARPACPLFWTLGANQVGKAALSAWREVLVRPSVRLWPFDGGLDGEGLVVAETYPTACAGLVGAELGAGRSKRRQLDRAAVAPALLAAARRLEVAVPRALASALRTGLGPAAAAEDAFDSLVGVLGMLHVVLGHRAPGPPPSVPLATTVEGWVLGV